MNKKLKIGDIYYYRNISFTSENNYIYIYQVLEYDIDYKVNIIANIQVDKIKFNSIWSYINSLNVHIEEAKQVDSLNIKIKKSILFNLFMEKISDLK